VVIKGELRLSFLVYYGVNGDLYGKRIHLREIKENDIDVRCVFGRPKEFAYMCGGS